MRIANPRSTALAVSRTEHRPQNQLLPPTACLGNDGFDAGGPCLPLPPLPYESGIAIRAFANAISYNACHSRFRCLRPQSPVSGFKQTGHRSSVFTRVYGSRNHPGGVALRLTRPSSLSMFCAVDFTSGPRNPSTTGRDEEGNIPAFQQYQRCWDSSTMLSTWPQGIGPWCMAKTVSTFRFARLTACATSRINSGSYNDPSSFNARVSLA